MQRAVHKAPANEVVNRSLGFEKMLNKAQQGVLNPEGINCLRFFEGRGYSLWGAAWPPMIPSGSTSTSRRYFAYLEASIDRGTQMGGVRAQRARRCGPACARTVSELPLQRVGASGALLGTKPEEAFFVHCDRSTMTQNDLDNGRPDLPGRRRR